METNFQRVGAVSNTQVGNEFEEAVCLFFAETGTRCIMPHRSTRSCVN
jgi:hypothetical protein